MGASASAHACPLPPAPALPAGRLPAGRRALVGHAASLWQSRRLYGAGSLLFFACGHPSVCPAESGDLCRAWRLCGCLHLRWRGARHARAAPALEAAHCAADTCAGVGCGIAHCSSAGGCAAGAGAHALGGRGPPQPGAAHRARCECGGARSGLRLLWLFAGRLQLCLSLRRGVPVAFSGSGPPLFPQSAERGHRGGSGRGVAALSRRSAHALLWQHGSAAVRSRALCDRHVWRSRHAVAVGNPISVHFHRRRVCGCV